MIYSKKLFRNTANLPPDKTRFSICTWFHLSGFSMYSVTNDLGHFMSNQHSLGTKFAWPSLILVTIYELLGSSLEVKCKKKCSFVAVTQHFEISSFLEMLLHSDSLKYLMTLVLIKIEGLVLYQLKILKLGFHFTFH